MDCFFYDPKNEMSKLSIFVPSFFYIFFGGTIIYSNRVSQDGPSGFPDLKDKPYFRKDSRDAYVMGDADRIPPIITCI